MREPVAASTAPEKRLTADVWGTDVWGADFWGATSVALLPRGVVMVASVVADPIPFSHLASMTPIHSTRLRRFRTAGLRAAAFVAHLPRGVIVVVAGGADPIPVSHLALAPCAALAAVRLVPRGRSRFGCGPVGPGRLLQARRLRELALVAFHPACVVEVVTLRARPVAWTRHLHDERGTIAPQRRTRERGTIAPQRRTRRSIAVAP